MLRDRAVIDSLTQSAARLGIPHLGVSAKDLTTCAAALDAGLFDHVQLPVNPLNDELARWARLHAHQVTIVGNRPYGSGQLISGDDDRSTLLGFARRHVGDGVVLTGTTKPHHLRQSAELFAKLNAD